MVRFSLEGYTDKCVKMLHEMTNPKHVKADKQIPTTLIKYCEGIAFITIYKAGFFVLGANAGAGCVIAKVKDPSSPRGWRWSGPASVVCGGLGGGFTVGGQKIDSIIILNTKSAVRAFMGEGQVTFGGNLSIAAGPAGRDIEGHVGLSNTKEIVAAYSYSKAQGVYLGATLEGAFCVSRNSDNKRFYQDQSVTPERILMGEVIPPPQVNRLHQELYTILDRKRANTTAEHDNANYGGPAPAYSGQDQQGAHQYHAAGGMSNMPPEAIAPAIGAAATAFGQSMASAMSTQQEGGLPPFWKKVFTPDGKPYYHNTQTNETSWNIPTAAAPPPPPPAPGAGGQYVVANYDFTATRPGELSFKANDRLLVQEKVDANWYRCSLNGKPGLVPANYVSRE
mmetsp:Transcript_21948/g.41170  ORF Transcript_21948/g.41170 Transcript_21948/m.41170 type:complete len:394 (-) Transcript_21948:1600-2781(-)